MMPSLKNYVKILTPKIQRLTHISARLDRSWLPDSSVFRALLELFKKWSISGIRFIFAEIDHF